MATADMFTVNVRQPGKATLSPAFKPGARVNNLMAWLTSEEGIDFRAASGTCQLGNDLRIGGRSADATASLAAGQEFSVVPNGAGS